MIRLLDELVAGKVESLQLDMAVGRLPDEVEYDMGDMDTNGWQVDYWFEATYEGTELEIHGSMFYGNMTIKVK